MLFGNDRHVQRKTASTEFKPAATHVDNKVRSAVAQEFSLMEQQHARMRAEALGANGIQEPAKPKPMNPDEL